ncbi:MAG TPA: DUF2589 domain-containing protein [Steroidobacteraceae bacterium]|nr:DUF2589 domain-containing protein [Steroidobacteraceae bacterium]
MAMTLQDLLEALASAVIGAQDRIEEHQNASLGSYFDSDNRPKSVLIRLPSLHPGAEEGDEDYYRAPLLSLTSANPLRIREVEIDFDVQLGEISEEETTDAGSGESGDKETSGAWREGTPRKTVQIDLHTAKKGASSSAVHVRVKVENTEITSGLAKLTNQLTQTQGVFKTVKVS